MIYKFNEKTLQFIKVNHISVLSKIILCVVFFFLIFGWSLIPKNTVEPSETEVKLIVMKYNEFSSEKLVDKIKSLNFKFPHIVYAQTILETNNFKSKMFVENNNLFGMKEAKSRITTAKGSQSNYAYYDNWCESLYDYALYSSNYLSSLNSKEDYLAYLSQNYAEDGSYINKLKEIINSQNLKKIFN